MPLLTIILLLYTAIYPAFNIFFLLIDFFFHSGHAIRCYDCNSHTDVGCSDKTPPKEFEKDCSEHKNGPKYTFCRKITQVIEFSVNNCKLLCKFRCLCFEYLWLKC